MTDKVPKEMLKAMSDDMLNLTEYWSDFYKVVNAAYRKCNKKTREEILDEFRSLKQYIYGNADDGLSLGGLMQEYPMDRFELHMMPEYTAKLRAINDISRQAARGVLEVLRKAPELDSSLKRQLLKNPKVMTLPVPTVEISFNEEFTHTCKGKQLPAKLRQIIQDNLRRHKIRLTCNEFARNKKHKVLKNDKNLYAVLSGPWMLFVQKEQGERGEESEIPTSSEDEVNRVMGILKKMASATSSMVFQLLFFAVAGSISSFLNLGGIGGVVIVSLPEIVAFLKNKKKTKKQKRAAKYVLIIVVLFVSMAAVVQLRPNTALANVINKVVAYFPETIQSFFDSTGKVVTGQIPEFIYDSPLFKTIDDIRLRYGLSQIKPHVIGKNDKVQDVLKEVSRKLGGAVNIDLTKELELTNTQKEALKKMLPKRDMLQAQKRFHQDKGGTRADSAAWNDLYETLYRKNT